MDILDILAFPSGIQVRNFFSATKKMKIPENLRKSTCERCQTCSRKEQDGRVS